jgi:hypothetical protein
LVVDAGVEAAPGVAEGLAVDAGAQAAPVLAAGQQEVEAVPAAPVVVPVLAARRVGVPLWAEDLPGSAIAVAAEVITRINRAALIYVTTRRLPIQILFARRAAFKA